MSYIESVVPALNVFVNTNQDFVITFTETARTMFNELFTALYPNGYTVGGSTWYARNFSAPCDFFISTNDGEATWANADKLSSVNVSMADFYWYLSPPSAWPNGTTFVVTVVCSGYASPPSTQWAQMELPLGLIPGPTQVQCTASQIIKSPRLYKG
jgi:hypothetical protein